MSIIWNGPVLDPSGYGNCARSYVKALHEHYDGKLLVNPVRYFRGEPKDFMSEEMYNLLYNLYIDHNIITSNFVHVEHKTPGALTYGKYKKSVAYTVWETDRVPANFVYNLNNKDEIWTASKYSKNAMLNAGVTTPIQIIPHIIDFDMFNIRAKARIDDNNKMVFLFNGEFTTRKGVDTLVKAFLKAFDKNDQVVLLLKTYILTKRGEHKELIKSTIKKWIYEVSDPDNCPEIRIWHKLMSDDDIPSIYSFGDVFVTATRGEGFGIPIAEAMAHGMLVVAPNKGGHTDFCNDKNSILIDSEVKDIPDDMLEDDRKVYSGQKWIDTSEEHLISVLRSIYNYGRERIYYGETQDMRVMGNRTIKEYCDSKRICDLIKERL